jgi:hypothetical protein
MLQAYMYEPVFEDTKMCFTRESVCKHKGHILSKTGFLNQGIMGIKHDESQAHILIRLTIKCV